MTETCYEPYYWNMIKEPGGTPSKDQIHTAIDDALDMVREYTNERLGALAGMLEETYRLGATS